MSDLIRRDEAIQEIKLFFTSIISEMPCNNKHEIIDTELANIFVEFNKGLCVAIRELPTAEPTIDDIAERISDTDWYHIFKGELRHGAQDREEALFKAEDIFNILKDMGASDI